MNISFYTTPLNFGKDRKLYNLGYNDGKRDGLIGKNQHLKDYPNKTEYNEAYNKGYLKGKEERVSQTHTATVTDVIQDVVMKGKSRKEAIEFVAQYLGGW